MDKKKYNAEVKPVTVKFTASIPDPVVSTTPAKKYLIGSQIEDLRDRVSLAPYVIAETLDMVYSTPPKVSEKLIGGKKHKVYTYKDGGTNEASFMSVNNKVDIPTILQTTKEITDYADKNGTMKQTDDGYLAEIEINDYMKHLGYAEQKAGGFKTRDRRKVWQDLKRVFSTPVKRAVRFKSGNKDKTLVFEAPIIHYAEIHDDGDTKRVLTVESEGKTPPQSFLIGIVPEVAKQMTGFKEGGLYFHRNLIVEPRTKAEDYKHDLQGYKVAVRDRLFLLFKKSPRPIRRYAVKDLTEVISGRDKDKRRKLKEALNTIEQRVEIKEWGFADSRNKRYGKNERSCNKVWVDHTDTDVYKKYEDIFKSKKSDTAKMREEIKRLKKQQKKNTRKIDKVEKDL